ncbi:MAG: MqnA/MqnD/SBP family protein [Bacteroidota bacterium]
MSILVTQYHDHSRALIDALALAMGPTLEPRDLPASEVAWALFESEADLALASPLLYGQRESDMTLLGGACVAAVGATGEWLLHFNSGLHSIQTVGFFGERGMPTMLAEIVLKEKFGMAPKLLQVGGDAQQALATVDALLTTDDLQRSGLDSPAHIDVIDEWFDMTQLPLVREIFIGWKTRMDASIDAAIRSAGDLVDTEALHAVEVLMEDRNTLLETEAVPSHFRYRLTEDAIEGLEAFLQMAFFHGLHRDIPDVVFWAEEDDAEEVDKE